jgi:hypothetical protein
LLPIVSGVTIVSISFLQSIAVPPYPLGMRNGVIGSLNSQNEFQECIDQLHEIMSTYEQTHQVIIGGDFNEEITNINTT